jgi:hypothetical protein
VRFAPTLIICLLTAHSAVAGPWLAPGDMALRSDLQLLADAGVLTAPITTWPLAWGDIAASLDTRAADLRPDEMAALARVERELSEAMRTGHIILKAHASAAANPRQIRTFEDGPREDAEIGVGVEWTGDWFAVNLEGQWVDDPDDGDDWRADNSYIGVALGNWMIAGSTQERFWGPGWQSSLIMSNNARPFPAITLERNSTAAFKTKWLSWLGQWDAAVIFGFLEKDRAIPDAQMFGLRFNFKPLPNLEIGVSRSALWCGDGQSCDLDSFADVLFRGDDGFGGDSNPDQLGGFDVRWSSSLFEVPFALYGQMIGEDESSFWPTQWLGQFGAETWGNWDGLGRYRFYFEWADTECNFRLYQSIRGDDDGSNPGCAYSSSTYKTGQHYKGPSFAHSFDADSSVFTLGGMLNDEADHSWVATIAIGNLNRRGAKPNYVAASKTRYQEYELSHRRDIWIGDINVGLGYDYRKLVSTGDTDNDIRAFLEWSVEY